MSIASTDLKCYGAASMPEDDASTSGGAISTVTIVDDMVLAAADTLIAVSSTTDTMNLTITGRTAAGAIVSEVHALNGTTPVNFTTNSLERVLKMVLASGPAGTVTVTRTTGGATVVVIPIGKTSVRRLFYDCASTGSITNRYEKLFWKNEHATLTLTSAQMTLTADPAAHIQIACATAVDDTGSVANRLTLPGGLTFVDDGVAQSVPGAALAAGSAIGVWINLNLAANNAAVKSTFTTQLSGSST